MKEEPKVQQWEKIAYKILANPHSSRSEVDCAIIGVKRSENLWLKEQLQLKRKKAWVADVK